MVGALAFVTKCYFIVPAYVAPVEGGEFRKTGVATAIRLAKQTPSLRVQEVGEREQK